MKYCEEYAALLDLFVDGELAPEDMKRVGDHLTGCPGCQEIGRASCRERV